MKFLVLGGSGMAGHTISIYLQERGHEVTAFTRKPFAYTSNIVGDITDLTLVDDTIRKGEYDAVINGIGILNKDAETHKRDAVFLNSYLPHYLSELTKHMKTQVIHMSTDCVFSGESGNYHENSLRDGIKFYDRSKALGELENDKDLTLRTSIIGPDMNVQGIGLFNWFMKQSGEVSGYSRAIWTGVTTLTLAKAMEEAASQGLSGLYNLVNNQSISKYDLISLFNRFFKDNAIKIINVESVVLNKSLVNNRDDFDFHIPSYEEMVIEMKEWVDTHQPLYAHYFEQTKG